MRLPLNPDTVEVSKDTGHRKKKKKKKKPKQNCHGHRSSDLVSHCEIHTH